MRRNSWLFGLLALSMLVWSPYDAAADPWKDESGNGKYEREYEREYKYKEERKREYRSGDCKYEYKVDKNGNKEETNCGTGPRSVVEQPSWVTALREWLRQVTGETEE